MDTIFDTPRWNWRLRRNDADLGRIGNHDCRTAIVIPEVNEPRVLGRVELVPPSATFFFLRARSIPADAETYFHIVIRDKRAYMHLYAYQVGEDGDQPQNADWPLFYWTKSNAPNWLKKHL